MKYFKEIIKPFNYSIVEAKLAFILGTTVTFISHFSVNYLGISGKFCAVLLILLATDFITGISGAIKQKRRITSRKGLRTVYKAGGYILFMYVTYNLSEELDGKAELFQEVVKYFHIYIIVHICFWELFSIDENLKKIGIDLGVTDLLKLAYNNIKKIFNRLGDNQGIETTETEYYESPVEDFENMEENENK